MCRLTHAIIGGIGCTSNCKTTRDHEHCCRGLLRYPSVEVLLICYIDVDRVYCCSLELGVRFK